MAITKEAMNSFRIVKTPADKDGRLLKQDEFGRYVHIDDGTLADPTNSGKYSPVKYVRRPLMTEGDLLDKENFPIQARTLRLKKYKDLVEDLRAAVKSSGTGIVNFVIGQETESAEAVLKMAFPPGSGTVYKGTEGGYDINASNFANAEDSLKNMKQLLRGNAATINEKSLDYYRKISAKMEEEWNALPASEKAKKIKPITPIEVLVGQAGAAPGQAASNPYASRSTTPAAAPAATGAQTPHDQIIKNIRRYEESIKASEAEMEGIKDRHNESSKGDPDKMSQADRFRSLRAHVHSCKDKIDELRRSLSHYRSDFGEAEYDKTGFIDFDGESATIYKRLSKALDVDKSLEAEIASGRTERPTTDTEKTKMLSALYNQNKEQALMLLQSVKQSNEGRGIDKYVDNISSMMNKGWEAAKLQERAIKQAITFLGNKLSDMQKVMIMQNSDDPSMVEMPGGAHAGGNAKFRHSSLLSDHFVPENVRKKRSIVFVSRVPVDFGFDCIRVPKNSTAFLVDDEEGAALVDYYLDLKRTGLMKAVNYAREKQKAGSWDPNVPLPSPNSINVSSIDIKRVAKIVSGKTQAEARKFLSQVFEKISDPTNKFALSGSKLIKQASKMNNDEVTAKATYTNDEGQSSSMFFQVPKLTMDEYIYSKKSNWGSKVAFVNDVADLYKSKMDTQARMMSEAYKIKCGLVPGKTQLDAVEIENKCNSLEKEANLAIRGLRHFVILYGLPGCGKSAYPQALANKLGFNLVDADLSQARGSLVGQTERWGKAMINSWKTMSDVVIRMDEIDNMASGEKSSGQDSHLQAVMKALLDFFQNEIHLLEDRNIFIIATTNNLDQMRDALVNRASIEKVPHPFDMEGYQGFLTNAMGIIKADTGQGPYAAENIRSSDGWAETKEFWATFTNEIPKMAAALLQSGLNFRQLGAFIRDMFHVDFLYKESLKSLNLYNTDRNQWLLTQQTDENGKPISTKKPKLVGFPFTAENFIKAATLTYPTDDKDHRIQLDPEVPVRRVHVGINDLIGQMNEDRSGAMPGAVATGPQPELDFGGNSGNDDLMSEASTDYYYNQLMKAGFVDNPPQETPAEQAPVETQQQKLLRISKGDIRPGDSFDDGQFAMYPVQ